MGDALGGRIMRTILALGIALGVLGAVGRADAAPIIGVDVAPLSDCRGLACDGAMPGEQQFGLLSITNTGTSTLTVTDVEILNSVAGITFSDPVCGDGTVSCPHTFSVPVNNNILIAVQCNAPVAGSFSSTVVVASDAASGSNTATLTCKGFFPPTLAITPSALDFGTAHICDPFDTVCGPFCNTQPATQTLTITNTAPAPSEIDLRLDLQFLSGGPESWDVVTDRGASPVLLAGESAHFTFTFHPRHSLTSTTLPIQIDYPPATPPVQFPFAAHSGTGQFQMDGTPILSGPIGQPVIGTLTGHSSGESCIDLDEQGIASDTGIMAIVDPQIDINHQRLLQSGESITWHITCTPQHALLTCDHFELGWLHDDPETLAVYPVCCRGDGGALVTDPVTAFFDQVPIGSSATQRVRVFNAGNQPTDIVALTPDDPHFTVALVGGQLPLTLAPGAETQIDVTFTPTDTNRVSAGIILDGSNGDDGELRLGGQGIVVAIAAVPPTYDYGTVALPTTPSQTFELHNTGDLAAVVQAVALDLPNDYVVTGIAAGTSIDPGATLAFTVSATPTLLGARRATLAIAFDHGAAVNIPLAALASDPALVVTTEDTIPTDGELAFGGVDVDIGGKVAHVHLHDAGGSAIELASCAIAGDSAFTVAGGCPTTIAAGGDTEIAIAFAPTAEADARATLTITGTGFATGALRIDLHGFGLDQHVSLSAMTAAFPDTFRYPTAAATQIVTVRNTAATQLALTSIAVDGAGFSLVGPSSATLAPNETVDITVAFSPTAVAAYTGHLTLGNADDPTVAAVALTGRGIARDLAIAPLAIDLGSIVVGTTVHGAIAIRNTDAAATFTIARVTWTGDAAVQLVEPTQRTLAPGQSVTLDVVVTPTAAGPISGHVAVFADGDPDAVADITVTADGVTPPTPSAGGCGCTTGDATGLPLVLALAAFVLRRRR